MKIETNEIYNKNCLDGMENIPNESINAIITDPPYFLGMTHNGKKGVFNDLNISEPFFKELFKSYSRILKKDGVIYFFTDWRGYAFYYPIMQDYLPVKNLLVWDKGSGPGSTYGFSHELIILATQRNRMPKGSGLNIITGIKSFSGGAKKTNGQKVHPTQKPLELMEKLIKDSTKEGDIILDTFLGSGTTAIAAINTNRNYIGFELDEKHYKVAQNRINEAKEQLTQIN